LETVKPRQVDGVGGLEKMFQKKKENLFKSRSTITGAIRVSLVSIFLRFSQQYGAELGQKNE
jgi:hypothetical protein